MCVFKESTTYKRKKREIENLSDKELMKKITHDILSAQEKIEGRWKKIIEKENHKENEDQEGNCFKKLKKSIEKRYKKWTEKREEKKFSRSPYEVELDEKYRLKIYHKRNKGKDTISFYDLVLLELRKPKFRFLIYGYHLLVVLTIVYMLCQKICISVNRGLLFFYGISVLGAILERIVLGKKFSGIFWGGINEPTKIRYSKIFFLMDSSFDTPVRYIYIGMNMIMSIYIFNDINITASNNWGFLLALIPLSINSLLTLLCMLYLIKITWFFLPFIVIVALSFTSNESWQIVALAFPLMELMISEDFWLYMAEDIVPKFIKDPNDKVKKVVSSNLNKMKIKRLLYYVGIYIYPYILVNSVIYSIS